MTRLSYGLVALLFFHGACDAFTTVGPEGCDENTPCRGTARCDLQTRRCLPTADPEPLRACLRHDQCVTGICDVDGLVTPQPGLCVPDAQIAAPRTAAELFLALREAAAVRLPAGALSGDFVVSGRTVLVVGPTATDRTAAPAVLTPRQAGPVVAVREGGRLLLDGVTLQGARGATGHGASCEGGGGLWLRRVVVTDNDGRGVDSACRLLIDQSVIGAAGLSPGNRGGGVYASGDVTLWNSFIIGNGGYDQDFGGLALHGDAAVQRSLAYLTLVGNHSRGLGSAVQCFGGDPQQWLWRSLVYGNEGRRLEASVASCIPVIIATDDQVLLGGGSIALGPNEPPQLTGDGHLQADSPVIDRIPLEDGGPAIFYDFDGDPRPSGPRSDFGADEYVPRN